MDAPRNRANTPAALVLFGLVIHPLAGIIATVLTGRMPWSNFAGALFFTAPVVVPLLIAAGIATALQRSGTWPRALRWGWATFAATEVLLQTAAQLESFRVAPTDAQGALAFLFAPLWAHAGAALIGAVGLVSGAIADLRGRGEPS